MPIETKCTQAYRILRQQILKGRWLHGTAIPPERQLLKDLGISQGTLRNAVTRLVSEGLVRSVHGSGTYVTYEGEAPCVAILMHEADLVSPVGTFSHALADEFRLLARAAGYQPQTILGQGGTVAEFNDNLGHLGPETLTRTVGAICTTPPLRFADLCRTRGVPFAAVGCSPTHGLEAAVASVVWEPETRLMEMVQRLRDRGRPDFAVMMIELDSCLMYDHDPEGNDRRLRRAAAAVEGDYSRIVSVPYTIDYRHAPQAFRQWWERTAKPATIFFLEHGLCQVTLPTIQELGIRVPEDLGILTFSHTSLNWQFPVELTRLEFDAPEIMRRCWELLQAAMDGEPLPEREVIVRPRLVEGESLPDVRQSVAEVSVLEGDC